MNRSAEIRTLKAFVTVAKEGNISRAAEILHITQPAISLQLKRLAEDTGLTLFRRTARGMELTRDGAAMLVKAERVFNALSEFSQTAERVRGQVRGRLRIGTIVDPDFIRLGQFLAGLVDAFPDLRTELVHGMSGEVVARLLRDQIDVGFYLGGLDGLDADDGDSKRSSVHQLDLSRITYRVVAPAGWERFVIGKDWADLAVLPWIGTPAESVHSRLLTGILAGYGVTQNRVAVVDQEPAMLAMVKCGVGLSLCRDSIALNEQQSRGLVIADRVHIDTKLSFVTLGRRLTEPNICAALKILEDVWSLANSP